MLQMLILILFFLSGVTGLVYEIIWTRVFGLVFGNTTLAFSAVLSAFMMGLATGSLVIGKRTESMKQHLKIYAFLEFGIGVCALLIPLFIGPLEQLFSFFWLYTRELPFLFYLLKFIFAFLIMFPATFFLGGTLPVLSHVFIHSPNKIGLDTGKLYGINTLGAMTGAFLTGFILIRNVGVFPSLYLAVVINLTLAVSAFLLARFFTHAATTPEYEKTGQKSTFDYRTKLIIAAMAVSGFTALSYEVLWNHVLVFILTNSVYALSVMLTTVLAGIGLGSYFGGRLADRIKNLPALFGWIEVAIGVSALVAAGILINLSAIHNKIFTINPNTLWWAWNGIRFIEAFIVIFFPACFMGIVLPVASRIVTPAVQKIGARLGLIYFFNTLGGVIGSFLTAFVFIAVFGVSATMAALVVLNLILGAYFILYIKIVKRIRYSFFYIVLVLLLTVCVITITPGTFFSAIYTHVEKDHTLIDYREGIEGTVTVHEINRPFEQNLRIDVDGLNVAGTSFMLKTLQTLQGHLPVCLHGNAKQVLQIGFGTGQTSKSVLRHSVDEFTLVEISRDVLDLSDCYFQEINEGVIRHAGFNSFIADGKNFVKYTRHNYDVIMNDANYAVATASASLFTLEHFQQCKRKLKPGGIFSTWMTIDLDPVDFQIVLKTFQSVFPYCTLWMAPNCVNKQIVLIGAEQPWKIDYPKLKEQFADSSIRKDFADININSAFDVLDCFLLDHDGIRQISKDAPINSDNHPILEFSTRDIRSRDLCSYQNLGKMIHRRPEPLNFLVNLAANEKQKIAIEQTLKRHYLATGLLLRGILENYQGNLYASSHTLIEGSRLIPESNLAKQFFEKIDLVNKQLLVEAGQGPENPDARLNLARYSIGLHKYDEALRNLRSLEKRYPDNIQITFEMARAFQGIARTDSARIYIFKTLQLKPDFAAALYFGGELESRLGNKSQAQALFNKALQADNRMYEAYNSIGRIYAGQLNYRDAIQAFQKSLNIMEFQPAVMSDLADCYMQVNDLSNAIWAFKKAQSMGLHTSQVYFNLANAYYMTNNFTLAEDNYHYAISLDSLNAEIFYNFGNSLVMQKKMAEAITAFKKAVTLNPQEPDYFNNLAMSLRHTGNLNESVRVFQQALKLFPQSKQLQDNYHDTVMIAQGN